MPKDPKTAATARKDVSADTVANLVILLAQGAKKTLDNAVSLFHEAKLLADHRFFSRAYLLHQISLEECAKIEMLGESATSAFMGTRVDVSKLHRRIRSHEAKNRTNAYFQEVSQEEREARDSGDIETAREVFSKLQEEFHQKANTRKNASLYVDFQRDQFITPSECITPEMVAEIAFLNDKHLGMAHTKVDMLDHWARNPNEMRQRFAGMKEQIEALAAVPAKELQRAFGDFIDDLLRKDHPSKGSKE